MDVNGSWDDVSNLCHACDLDDFQEFDTFWTRGWIPPPPRPPFLSDNFPSDGLACDLCTWATSTLNSAAPTSSESPVGLPWSISLVVVSIVSALIGASLMVAIRRCLLRQYARRDRDAGLTNREGKGSGRRREEEGRRRWWGERRVSVGAGAMSMMMATSNHYTVDEPTYQEPVYDQLDKPVYQNTANHYSLDLDSPSSAYYSDLSERTYETVGDIPLATHRLSSVAENSRVISVYI